MCDRYSFTLSKEKTARRYGVKVYQTPEVNYNIAYEAKAAAIIQDLPLELSFLHWGMQVPKAKSNHAFKQIYTVDIASLPKQPYVQELIKHHKCIVPADGFYLWKKISRKGKVPYRVVLKWNLPFAMAGIYMSAERENKKSFAVLSVHTNTLLKPISSLMPAILSLEHEKTWLNPELSIEDACKMLTPYPPQTMKIYPASARESSSLPIAE